jgi:hypothetical protein
VLIVPVAGIVGAVATGAVNIIGAMHEPVAVRVHVAGKPSSAHVRVVVVAVLGAVTTVEVPYGVHTSVAEPAAYWNVPVTPLTEHAEPNPVDPVVAAVEGALVVGTEVRSGAMHEPDAVRVHVAGKPRETHDEKLVVEAADPANGIQMIVAEPLR